MSFLSIKSIAAAMAAVAVGAVMTATTVTASAASTALVEWDGTAAEDFAGGTGTASDPYLISNGQELAYFIEFTDYLADNTGEYFKLTSDILLNDSFDDSPNEWLNENGDFEGVFDGDGHTIYGLYQNGELCSGIIGTVTETGVIKDLNVADAYIVKASMRSGIVCGHNLGTVSNCTSSGYIQGNSTYLGGVCGSVAVGVVENCINYATVESDYQRAGGITGAITDGGTVRNCYNAGNVTCTSPSKGYQVGGICGFLEAGSISACGNVGDVSNLGSGTGGIVGTAYDNCTITNCYNTGYISGYNSLGGLWGFLNSTDHSVSFCYNAGDVVASVSTGAVEYQIGNTVAGCISNVYYDSNVCTAIANPTTYAKTTAQLTASSVINDLGFSASVWSKSSNTSNFLSYPNLSAISADAPKKSTGTAAAISSATISAIGDQGYATVALTPEVVVTMGTERLVEGRDYTVTYSNNTNIGTATVTVKGTGSYSGTKTATFKITAKPAGGLTVPEITGQVYTGSELKPTFQVYNGTKLLTSGTDYTYTYSDNINAGYGMITLTGKGSYTGTKKVKFEIDPKNINLLTFPAIPDQYYNFGKTIWPDMTITDGSYTLEYFTDYTTQGVPGGNLSKIGKASFYLFGQGNYNGNVVLSFNIIPIPVSEFIVYTIGDQKYTGSAITPAITVKHNGTVLTEGTHYSVAYSNNVNPGTATVTITGLDYYSGTKTVNFAIKKAVEDLSLSTIADQVFTGLAIRPAVTVKDGSTTLVEDTHYYTVYSDNKNAGTASITIVGMQGYIGKKTITFNILAQNASNLTVNSISDTTYTGSAITPFVKLKNGNVVLTEGTDYTITYSNNINAGTATVTLRCQGNYTGTRTVTFNIIQASLKYATVASIADQPYTGSAIKPAVTVDSNYGILVADRDYTVSYSNNINIGTATVTITGIGNFKDSPFRTTTFNIVASPISSATVSSIADQTYTGSAIKPSVTVKIGSRMLTNGTDYTVAYSNNINVGTATITITGKGNYTGTKTVTFNIVAPPVLKPEISVVAGEGSATITWDAVDDATNYRVFSYLNGKYAVLGETTSTSYKATGLTGGTKYGFLVRAYVNGAWTAFTSDDVVYATPTAPAVTKPVVTATAGVQQVALKWNAVAGATKYNVYSYLDSKYTLLTTTTSTAYTATGLTAGTKYGFLVRAYANGTWSTFTTADNVYATPTAPATAKPVVTATAGTQQVALKWNAVTGATKYNVYSYLDSKYTLLTTTTSTSYTATGLTAGTKYGFLVRAYANGAWSAFTTADNVYATPVAPAVTKPVLTLTAGNGKIAVRWNAISGATKYNLYIYDGSYTLLTSTTATNYVAGGLTNGTRYGFLVRAYVNGAWTAFTTADNIYATPTAATKPVVTVTAGDDSATLTWNTISGATKYNVYSYINGKYTLLATNISTTYRASSLTSGAKYGFLVRAHVNGELTAFSNADLTYATIL